LQRTREGERLDVVLAAIRAEAAAVLAVDVAEIDPGVGLFEMGMDSLMSVELKRRLEAVAKKPLPATLTFNYPSANALAGYLLGELAPSVADPATTESATAPPIEAIVETSADELDDMSEDDLAELLTARLTNLNR
jgi:acyl carrier protein